MGVCKNSKWGFISGDGDLIINCQFDIVDDFEEGLALVKLNGKTGFIDLEGNIVIAPIYLKAQSFLNGLAAVTLDGKHWGFIDKIGEMVVPFTYDNTSRGFREGLCSVSNGKYLGVIDTQNTILLPFEYSLDFELGACASFFKNGLMVAGKNFNDNGALFGLINTNGEEIIPLKFQDLRLPCEGFSQIHTQNMAGYWSLENHEVAIPPIYEDVSDFINGVAVVSIV